MKHSAAELRLRMIAFLGALTLLLGGAFIGYMIEGYLLAVIIEFVLLTGIMLLRSILRPAWAGRSKLRLYMLFIFGCAASSMGGWNALLLPPLAWAYQKLGWPAPQQVNQWHQLSVLIVVGIVIIVLTWLFERQNILEPPQVRPRGSIQAKSFTVCRWNTLNLRPRPLDPFGRSYLRNKSQGQTQPYSPPLFTNSVVSPGYDPN